MVVVQRLMLKLKRFGVYRDFEGEGSASVLKPLLSVVMHMTALLF